MQVKGNQKNLLKDCERTAREQKPASTHRTHTRAHGRKEKRTVTAYPVLDFFTPREKELWPTVASVLHCYRERSTFATKTKQWTVSEEHSFYVGTRTFTAREADCYIRRHWYIENKNHYVRDVSMHEDTSRIRIHADRMVRLRSFALNILRANGEKNIKRALYENALSLQKVLDYRCMV